MGHSNGLPRGSRAPIIADLTMARRHGGSEHAFAVINQVLARQDGDFLPATPVSTARLGENRVQPGLVEWDIFSCVFKELRKLAALIFKELRSWPMLAFHQHSVEIFFKRRWIGHGVNVAKQGILSNGFEVLQFSSNGAEFWGWGGFRFDGLQIVGYKFRESGITSARGQVLQGGFNDNFDEKSGFSPQRHNCRGHVWQRILGC